MSSSENIKSGLRIAYGGGEKKISFLMGMGFSHSRMKSKFNRYLLYRVRENFDLCKENFA